MTGSGLPDERYTAEALPYVRAGMMVCQYSIDGGDQGMELNMQLLNRLLASFQKAEAGTINGRIALDYVLDKFPDVDMERIYSAGHSSSGTASLLLASTDSRIKKCVAYAPICFLDRRLGEVINHPDSQEIEGLNEYVRDWSPHRRVKYLQCPVLLFHSRDDRNEPFKNTEDFANLVKASGNVVRMVFAEKGGHYQSMIDQGIPTAIKWLKE